MRIGLLADTHIPDIEQAVPDRVMDAFRDVDLILHAGDIYSRSVLDYLQRVAPVLAAKGDDDYILDERVKDRHVLMLEGKTVWLVHERPYSYRSGTPKNGHLKGSDPSEAADIIVFGHEHRTIVERQDGVLLVYPGSPTFLAYRRGPGTVALLDIEQGEARVRILEL
ncbi:MAG: YfcE family phosphodiesterase [Dehalococcoidia bacterium]|nr:YfcE family phosphodiesterase [Dehalococcoidia bacterium]